MAKYNELNTQQHKLFECSSPQVVINGQKAQESARARDHYHSTISAYWFDTDVVDADECFILSDDHEDEAEIKNKRHKSSVSSRYRNFSCRKSSSSSISTDTLEEC